MRQLAIDRRMPASVRPRVVATFLTLLLVTHLPKSVLAAPTDLPALCENAAHVAASESGVPVSVLRAITLTETGRKFGGKYRPWPWTVNMEGAGKWFETPEQAQAYVDRNFARGARSFDVGCFQLNYRWHGQAFASIEQMFDPIANARYAAKFLKSLYAETGDWSKAAGAYHSRTKKFADRYRKRFDTLRARLDGVAPPPQSPAPIIAVARADKPPIAAARPAQPVRPRVNTFPLLQAEASLGQLGSLVPIAGRVAPRRLVALE